MTKQKKLKDSAAPDGSKLWDEILKAIVSAMPSQLFPLFKEVYGREYPKGTPIILLGTETSSFQENSEDPPNSTRMDISLLVGNTDYYHLECQMKNDKEMVIRMFAYDVRFALTHTKTMDENTGEITLYFPRSVVIYPDQNNTIPEHLKCRVVFQDNSEHIYKVPTVKVQAYSLEEIRKKHLDLFIPYTILRLRPKLAPNIGQKLTHEELTEFVNKAILVLKEEMTDGYLTEREYHDYVRLFRFAADRVLAKYPQMRAEVDQMTEPLIKLSKQLEDEAEARALVKLEPKLRIEMESKLRAELQAEMETRLRAELQAEMETRLRAELQAEIDERDAEIQRLQELINQIATDKVE